MKPRSGSAAVCAVVPLLRRALDEYLAELRGSANRSRLLVRYYGEDAPAVLGRTVSR